MKRILVVLILIWVPLVATHSYGYMIFLWKANSTQSFDGNSYPSLSRTYNDIDWAEGQTLAPIYDESPHVSCPPVFWDTNSVGFYAGYLSEDVYGPAQLTEIQNALSTWDGVVSDTYLSVDYDGSTNRSLDTSDGYNVICFGKWSELYPAIGKTFFRLVESANEDSAEVLETDIILNDYYEWSTDTFECGSDTTGPDRDVKDIRSVVTHELGHALGLAHTIDWPGCNTMLDGGTLENECSTDTESLGMRSLETDDQQGLKEIYGPGNGDGYYVRNQAGADKPVAVVVPQATHLLSAYPNPFNPQVTIEFELEKPAVISLRINNLTGQLVRELISSQQYGTGRHRLVWKTGLTGQATGIYFVQLSGPDWELSKKVMLVR